MAQSIKKKYNLNIKGVLSFEDNKPIISIEDRGDFDLSTLLMDFDNREIKLSVSFDEEYGETEEELDVDPDTGEVI